MDRLKAALSFWPVLAIVGAIVGTTTATVPAGLSIDFTTLSDGADDPKQVYCHSTNINLHINDNGKAVVAADVRTNLNAAGF